jgi:hypothetical protein
LKLEVQNHKKRQIKRNEKQFDHKNAIYNRRQIKRDYSTPDTQQYQPNLRNQVMYFPGHQYVCGKKILSTRMALILFQQKSFHIQPSPMLLQHPVLHCFNVDQILPCLHSSPTPIKGRENHHRYPCKILDLLHECKSHVARG